MITIIHLRSSPIVISSLSFLHNQSQSRLIKQYSISCTSEEVLFKSIDHNSSPDKFHSIFVSQSNLIRSNHFHFDSYPFESLLIKPQSWPIKANHVLFTIIHTRPGLIMPCSLSFCHINITKTYYVSFNLIHVQWNPVQNHSLPSRPSLILFNVS